MSAGGRRQTIRRAATLAAIFLVALLPRLPGNDRYPPAIHQDEASNVVDGWSLLNGGVDRAGRAWPVFLQGFGQGDNRTSLYAMLTIPGVALLGPGAVAARLPAAILGAWTVLALFLFARRVRGTTAAYWAAGLLAANPWHIYLSRFGHEASITPAFLITALWLVAGMAGEEATPDRTAVGHSAALDRRIAIGRWAAAGFVLAAGLYSYPSFRLFLPLILAAACVFKAGPRLGRASLALPAALAIGALPLLVASIAHPDRLLGRASATLVFANMEPLPNAFWLVARQYSRHFLPGFLFVHGDGNLLQSPPGGELLWVELPALALGIAGMARRRDRWDRFALFWLVLFPVASAITLGDRPDYVPHSLRAAIGLPLFQLIGGDGIATLLASVYRRRGEAAAGSEGKTTGTEPKPRIDPERPRRHGSKRSALVLEATWTTAIAVNLCIVGVLFTGRYARAVAPRYHASYPPAVRYLAANRGSYSALLISGRGVQQVHIYSILYGLHDLREYREGPKEISETGFFHLVRRVGEVRYFYSGEELASIASSLSGRVWALVSPGEVRGGHVVASFPYPSGEPALEVREIDL